MPWMITINDLKRYTEIERIVIPPLPHPNYSCSKCPTTNTWSNPKYYNFTQIFLPSALVYSDVKEERKYKEVKESVLGCHRIINSETVRGCNKGQILSCLVA